MKLLHRDAVTNTQMTTLVGTLNSVGHVFAMLSGTDSNVDGTAMDGGAKIALENSMVNLCERIDALVCDSKRWSLARHNELEDALIKTHKSIQKTNETAVSPHSQLQPKLVRLSDGYWLCHTGTISEVQVGSALIGIGLSPEQAIISFDKNFRSNKPKTDEITIVDPAGNQPTTSNEGGGAISAGDSGNLGADDQGSPDQTRTDPRSGDDS